MGQLCSSDNRETLVLGGRGTWYLPPWTFRVPSMFAGITVLGKKSPTMTHPRSRLQIASLSSFVWLWWSSVTTVVETTQSSHDFRIDSMNNCIFKKIWWNFLWTTVSHTLTNPNEITTQTLKTSYRIISEDHTWKLCHSVTPLLRTRCSIDLSLLWVKIRLAAITPPT